MDSFVSTVRGYLEAPLLPRGRRELATRSLPTVAAAILVAILLVHAFSPAGLSMAELLLHVVSIWLGFLLGMVAAVLLAAALLRSRARRPTVGVLWLVSALGFVFGLVIVGTVDSLGIGADTAAKAASLHGPRSMLLRLLPLWALVTAFLVRSEMLDAYESRFGALRLQAPPGSPDARASGVVTLGSGKSSVKAAVSSIALVSAEENYCQVLVRKGDTLSRTLVRATLQSIERELPHDRFIRLHRSHLVNADHVEQVQRRGRQFLVALRHWDGRVPISRSRVHAVLDRLEG